MTNVVAPIKRAAGKGKIMCGGCKGTGVFHVWNSHADLIPTNQKCPSCDGTGVSKRP